MKVDRLILVLIIISVIATFIVYSSLPSIIPHHWSFNGEVDRYGSRNIVFFTSLLPLGIYLLMKFLPKIDPGKDNYKKHRKAYKMTRISIVIVLIITHWVTIISALGYEIDVSLLIKSAVGLLLIIIGNYMGQIRHNYFFGIKNPWTLSDDEVWRKTHRVSGFGFIICGLIFVISAFFNNLASFIISIVFLTSFIIFINVYSYVIFKNKR